MFDLLFINPEFKEGINTTVRLGTKWAGLTDAKVRLIDANTDEQIGSGVIIRTKTIPYNQLTDKDCVNQHSASTRTLQGLKEALEAAYGDELEDSSTITLVTFEAIEVKK